MRLTKLCGADATTLNSLLVANPEPFINILSPGSNSDEQIAGTGVRRFCYFFYSRHVFIRIEKM